jgi:prevent-host-death family protein
MKIATSLLKARHIGIRELKANLSKFLKENTTMVITDHGTPTNVIVAYDDIVELVDVLDELLDKSTLLSVHEGRHAIANGSKGVPVSTLFNKIRKKAQ